MGRAHHLPRMAFAQGPAQICLLQVAVQAPQAGSGSLIPWTSTVATPAHSLFVNLSPSLWVCGCKKWGVILPSVPSSAKKLSGMVGELNTHLRDFPPAPACGSESCWDKVCPADPLQACPPPCLHPQWVLGPSAEPWTNPCLPVSLGQPQPSQHLPETSPLPV